MSESRCAFQGCIEGAEPGYYLCAGHLAAARNGPERRWTVFEGDSYEMFQCWRCGLWESYINEFYRWPEHFGIGSHLYCWDCWELVSSKKLNRNAKPPRKEAAE